MKSPCTNVCRIDAASGWCEGCLRTLDEIAAWSALDDAARRAVMQQLSRRRPEWRRLHVTVAAPTAEAAAGAAVDAAAGAAAGATPAADPPPRLQRP